jgi:small-conductance mechanosensitive channel
MAGGDLLAHSLAPGPTTLLGSCGPTPGLTCQLVWDVSHNGRAAEVTAKFLAGPVHLLLRVAFVVLLALIVRWLVSRVINRLTERATQSLLPSLRGGAVASRLVSGRLRRRRDRPGTGDAGSGVTGSGITGSGVTEDAAGQPLTDGAGPAAERGLVDERRQQRVRALGAILHSASAVIIFTIAGVIILGDLDINLAPLLASAGVVGLAVGFGAQTMVRDYLAGIFMMVEDQYGVGDVVTIGDATGSVENVTLRITRLRDLNGVVWHIRNGSIEQVGNESQGWARAVIDYPVPYQPDLTRVSAVLAEAARGLWDDPQWRAVLLEPPEVWGAQEITSDTVTMRIVVKTAPLRQWGVERELRARVKAALDAAGIHPPAEPPTPAASGPTRRTRPRPASG